MRFVALAHRWLGMVGCLLFIAWFASGIVMMYARMPGVEPGERLARAQPIDLANATLSPGEAAARQHLTAQRVVAAMLLGRPVYRFQDRARPMVVFADTGERFSGFTPEAAMAEAARLTSREPAPLRYDTRITDPDQWTLQARALLPMHRIAMNDADGTVLYLSDVNAQLAVRTTAKARRVAYAGAVLHWLYFTPFRKHGPLWNQSIIWLSLAGSVMCLLGLVWGVYVGIRSPYGGWMKWHHYSGLLFGVISFTWVFSGLLSMDPWDWHPGTGPTRAQREAFSGGPLRLDRVTLDDLRAHMQRQPGSAGPKEIEIAQFRGEPRLFVDDQPAASISREVLSATARAAMPGVPVADETWLESYDSYYYGRDEERPLPVLRVRYADAAGTWLYVDPARGAILRKEERLSRLNRWLYHGLHSLDFPWLYNRRPLWDIVVIVLSLGGIASAVTSLAPAWRRLQRHAQRLYT